MWRGGCKHSSCPVVPGSPGRAARESTAQHPLPQESGPGNRHPGGTCKKRDLSAHVGRDLRGQQPGPGLRSLQQGVGEACTPGLEEQLPGLPWRCSGQGSARQCRGNRLSLQSKKIPRAGEQLGPCAPTTEPELSSWEPRPRSPRAATTKTCAP